MAKKKQAKSTPKGSTPPEESSTTTNNYTVLARRYRPQLFSEVVGQEAVAQAFENAIKSNRVAHAYLFAGPRGVGKTSTARILAKALNCENGPTPTPCGKCDRCVAITAGEDVDVIEIDGASNNGVDEVRELRSSAGYLPSRSRYKIYIIDEVHMLTKQAFNALLKTLEEPPPHVKFIFATTDPQKILITILSRCQRFDFSGISRDKIKDRLRDIVQVEGKEAEDDALELVARRANGSMRDAQSLLDQLLSFSQERLTADGVHQLLGTASSDRVIDLATAVLNRDPTQALQLLDDLSQESLEFGELLDQLASYWRDLMVTACSGDKAPDVSVPSHHREALAEQAKRAPLDTILAGLDILTTARARLKFSNQGRLLVEMALVRLSQLSSLVSLSQLTEWVKQAPVSNPSPTPVKKKAVDPPLPNGQIDLSKANPEPLTEANLPQIWANALRNLGRMLRSELERAGSPAISGPNTLVLTFPSDYNRQWKYCQDPERAKLIEQTLKALTGEDWQLRLDLSDQPSPEAEKRRREGRAPRESGAARQRRLKEDVQQIPLIQRARDVLGADVRRVEDGFSIAPGPEEDESESSDPEAEA